MSAGYEAMVPLSAERQLSLEQSFPALLPALMGRGLGLEDALALAHNITLLFLALRPKEPLMAPLEVLTNYSLGEIARLCEQYGRMESGEEEWGINEAFEEAFQ